MSLEDLPDDAEFYNPQVGVVSLGQIRAEGAPKPSAFAVREATRRYWVYRATVNLCREPCLNEISGAIP